MDQKFKEFGGKIPEDEYLEFKDNFPQYGATQWLINEAVKNINRLVRETPAYRNLVAIAIENSLRKLDDSADQNPPDSVGPSAGQHRDFSV